MISTTLEIVGLDRVLVSLSNVERGIESLMPLWEQFGKEFYQEEIRLFDAAPWKPLSPEYAKRKQELFGDKPLLRATDTLFRSLTQQGSEGNVHRISSNSAEFGSNDFKAMLHRSGTARMPARDPLAEPDVERYATLAGEYVNALIN